MEKNRKILICMIVSSIVTILPLLWYDYLLYMINTPSGEISMITSIPLSIWIMFVCMSWYITIFGIIFGSD